MKIHKFISQHRNDFWADMICEHCDMIDLKRSGYDDDYFHSHVIPGMFCKACGKNRAGNAAPVADATAPSQDGTTWIPDESPAVTARLSAPQSLSE